MIRVALWTRCEKCRKPYEGAIEVEKEEMSLSFEVDMRRNFTKLVCDCGSTNFEPLKRIVEEVPS